MARSAIAYTHTHNSSISTTSKLPVSELEAVIFARLDIDWCHTNYISQVIDAQKTRLHTYETARGTSKCIESAANETAFEKTLLLGKLVSHTQALRKQLDNLASKRVASSSALPSSQAILASVMTMYPGCHNVNLKNMHRLPVDTVESHICMYGDLQLQLVSAIITASKTIAEMKNQQAYRTPTTVMTVKEKKTQKSDIATSETEIGENGSQQHDHFGDLPGLVSSRSDKLVTTSVRMIPQAITTAFERTSTDATNVAEFRDNYQPISDAVAYRSLLDEDDQERFVSRRRFQLEGPATCLELALANVDYRHWCRNCLPLSPYGRRPRRQSFLPPPPRKS